MNIASIAETAQFAHDNLASEVIIQTGRILGDGCNEWRRDFRFPEVGGKTYLWAVGCGLWASLARTRSVTFSQKHPATTIHGLQVRSVGSLTTTQRSFGLCRKARVTVSSRRSVANESIQDDYDIDGSISSWNRLVSSLPKLKHGPDELDAKILSTCIPTMLNLMVVPIVNAVDTFYVGQLRSPLALAAQSAANQCFFTVYFLAAFLPTITAPVVARAIGNKDWEEAKDRVCEVRRGLEQLIILIQASEK